jgi:hypothetical protein
MFSIIRCFAFASSCFESRDSHLRPWRRRGTRRRVPVPAGAPPVSSRSNLSRPNQIQRPGLEDTGLAGVFVKEPLGILSIEPAVQNAFRKYAFPFRKRRFVLISSEIRFQLFTELPLILF